MKVIGKNYLGWLEVNGELAFHFGDGQCRVGSDPSRWIQIDLTQPQKLAF